MPDIYIKVRGGSRVRVGNSWHGTISGSKNKSTSKSRSRGLTKTDSSTGSGGLVLGFGIMERLEIRVEAVFRPERKDVEVQYVLTGPQSNSPDKIHSLAADFIVPHADERSMEIQFGKVVESVRRERPEKTGLFIQVHSHPTNGIPEPSEADMETWRNVSSLLSKSFPRATILFGVHGVSRQHSDFIERTHPVNFSPNTLSWASNTRDHKIGFFSPSAKPYKVSYVD